MEIGVMQGRKAHQLSLVLSGFEISLLCLSHSQSLQQQQSGDARRERERERDCDRGRECAIKKKHLSEGWGGCYDNYLYSGLSVMF